MYTGLIRVGIELCTKTQRQEVWPQTENCWGRLIWLLDSVLEELEENGKVMRIAPTIYSRVALC